MSWSSEITKYRALLFSTESRKKKGGILGFREGGEGSSGLGPLTEHRLGGNWDLGRELGADEWQGKGISRQGGCMTGDSFPTSVRYLESPDLHLLPVGISSVLKTKNPASHRNLKTLNPSLGSYIRQPCAHGTP